MSRTLGKDVQDRKPLVLDSLFYKFLYFKDMIGCGPSDKCGPSCSGHFYDIKSLIYIAVWSCGSHSPKAGQRRELPPGHSIYPVIHDYGRHINIAPASINEMIPSNGQPVAIAH